MTSSEARGGAARAIIPFSSLVTLLGLSQYVTADKLVPIIINADSDSPCRPKQMLMLSNYIKIVHGDRFHSRVTNYRCCLLFVRLICFSTLREIMRLVNLRLHTKALMLQHDLHQKQSIWVQFQCKDHGACKLCRALVKPTQKFRIVTPAVLLPWLISSC